MPEQLSGGVVAAVEPGAAMEAGLRAADAVLSVDGFPLRDVIDWWWLTDEPSFTVRVRRGTEVVDLAVERRQMEPLGVTFRDVVFDSIRQCCNSCVFCFVSQLPDGLREALYVRDDDFRLSFLAGNFITLTNLDAADVDRIIGQHLSPLHVSVHAVDEKVRASLLCPTDEDRALEILDELLAGGIEVHVQIVLVPDLNDGAVLEETLGYLAEREGVLSVGCVPMGYTAHQKRWRSSYDEARARAVVEQVHLWQERMRRERGVGWVYAADEFYLLSGVGLPLAAAYDDFPQFENGIGMASAFVDEFCPPAGLSPAVTLVTGELFAPVLRTLLERAPWPDARILVVRNRLFGGNVSVTGLLGGRDIAEAIAADGAAGPYLVPDVVINSDGLLLDDVRASELAALAGADVRLVPSDAPGLIAAIMNAGEGTS